MPKLEIIVVDGGGSDNTVKLAKLYGIKIVMPAVGAFRLGINTTRKGSLTCRLWKILKLFSVCEIVVKS